MQPTARLEGPPELKGRVDTATGALPADLSVYETVVLDLDEVGPTRAGELRAAGFEGRIVGFFSHVDESLGVKAKEAGIETYPRGRFWRELADILS